MTAASKVNSAAKVAELKPERAAGREVKQVAADLGQVGQESWLPKGI